MQGLSTEEMRKENYKNEFYVSDSEFYQSRNVFEDYENGKLSASSGSWLDDFGWL